MHPVGGPARVFRAVAGTPHAAQSGCPHWQRGSGVSDISISAHRSLQNLLLPRSTRTSSQRQPAWSHFSSFFGTAWLDILGLFFDLDPPALARTHASTRRQVLLGSLFRKDAPRVTRRSGLAALASDRRHVLAVLADRPATLASRFPGLFRRKLVRGALLMRRPAAHPRDFSSPLFVHSGEPSSFSFDLRQRNVLLSLSLEKTALTRMKGSRCGHSREQQKMSHATPRGKTAGCRIPSSPGIDGSGLSKLSRSLVFGRGERPLAPFLFHNGVYGTG